jgi:Flp pilus assembly protein CpaB
VQRRAETDPADGSRPTRPLGRRVPLPAGRAIVGGLLVTVAAVATFAAYTSSNGGPTDHLVVANGPIRVGQPIHESDVRSVAVALPDEVLARSFATPGALEGAIAIAPIDADEPISQGAVRRGPEPGSLPRHEVTFALPREHALDGRLRPGEVIDLVATYGSGTDAYTAVVARQVRVLDADAASSNGVGSAGNVTITIGLDTDRAVLETTHALEIAKVNVVRSTPGAPSDGSDQPYAPTHPGPGSAPESAAKGNPRPTGERP